MLSNLQNGIPQNHKLQFDIRDCPRDIRETFRPQIVQAYINECKNPTELEPGEIRKVERSLMNHVHEREVLSLEFYGQTSFVTLPHFGGQMENLSGGHRPGRRLTSWRLVEDGKTQGFLHANGAPIEVQRHRP
jgi:hypothetical protein